jgi:uncharacterized phage protein (TIGR01671 family)
MREIKFRAWHKTLKEMLPNIQNHIGNDGWGFGQLLNDPNVEIMQYTGLKDRNGVEVYEGDIVRYSNPYSKLTYEHICLWDKKWACFGLFEKGNKWCKESDWQRITNIEVIGNIHEEVKP